MGKKKYEGNPCAKMALWSSLVSTVHFFFPCAGFVSVNGFW